MSENEIAVFVRDMAERHPELRRPVQWHDVRTIAAREGVQVSVLPLPRPARLIRYGDAWDIQISSRLDHDARAFYGVHELVHYWRDREDAPTFYAASEWEPEPREDFANMVAWYCTSTAREYFDRPRKEESDAVHHTDRRD